MEKSLQAVISKTRTFSVPADLRSLLELAMEEYPAARAAKVFGRASQFWPVVGALREALSRAPFVTSSRVNTVTASFGKGSWAEVPTLAVLDNRETETQANGVFVVYLFAADGSAVWLTLNQGSGDGANRLRARAAALRPRVATPEVLAAGFSAEPPELRAVGALPKAYTMGAIVSKAYFRGQVPLTDVLHADLTALGRSYRAGVPYRL